MIAHAGNRVSFCERGGVGVFCCDRLGWSFVRAGAGAGVGELNVSLFFPQRLSSMSYP